MSGTEPASPGPGESCPACGSLGESPPHQRRAGWRWNGPGSCHGPEDHGRRSDGAGVQIALLGMPNTGKSTLFNRLTGGNAQIANWPGLTVELLRGPLPDDGHGTTYELVDLPGIHDLSGSSED